MDSLFAVGEVFDGLARLMVLDDGTIRYSLGGEVGMDVGFAVNGRGFNGMSPSPRDLGRVNYFKKPIKVRMVTKMEDELKSDWREALEENIAPHRTYEKIR